MGRDRRRTKHKRGGRRTEDGGRGRRRGLLSCAGYRLALAWSRVGIGDRLCVGTVHRRRRRRYLPHLLVIVMVRAVVSVTLSWCSLGSWRREQPMA